MTIRDGPVALIDGDDIRVFVSIDDAFDSIEAVDLVDPAVALFDSLGAEILVREASDGSVVVDSTHQDEHKAVDVARKLAVHARRLRCPDLVPDQDALEVMTIAALCLVILKCHEAQSLRSRFKAVAERFTRT